MMVAKFLCTRQADQEQNRQRVKKLIKTTKQFKECLSNHQAHFPQLYSGEGNRGNGGPGNGGNGADSNSDGATADTIKLDPVWSKIDSEE